MSKRKLDIDISPLTDTIFIGTPSQDGKFWLSDKTDVTGKACAVVAKYVLAKGGVITVTGAGKPLYEIEVKICNAD